MAVTECVWRRSPLLLAVLVVAATLAGLARADAVKPSVNQSAARSAAHRKSHWRGRRRVWYVSATARPGGDGSRHAPFRSLSSVERASRAGEKIVILPALKKVAPLDGGIRLKPGQRLVGAGPDVAGRTKRLKRVPALQNTHRR